MAENENENSNYQIIDVPLFGRRDIVTSVEEITAENVVDEVNSALVFHLRNVQEEEFLYWYRRGLQPVLNRTKTRNEWVLNKVVENTAATICDFKDGYLLQEPCFYVSRVASKRSKVNKLNEYLYRSGKQIADNILANWFHMVGKAALYVQSNDDPDIPLKAYALDPRSAFVVYSMRPGLEPMYAVNVVIGTYESRIDVYTKDKVFRLRGGASEPPTTDMKNFETTATELVGVEANPLRHIPIIEYRYNNVNMGAFESVVPLLNSINNLRSDQVDGVDQFIQSIAIAVNCQFEEGTTAESIKRAGMIALSSIGENKADFKILSEELNQTQTEALVDSIYDRVLTICAVPSSAVRGRGTYDSTGQAAIFNNGWEQAAAAARNTEDLFRESNRQFDEILVDVLRRKKILEISPIDFKLSFVRNETANVQSKAQAAQIMLGMGMHPELAFKKSGLSNDPVADVKMSEKYLKLIWGDPDTAIKAEEAGNGMGEEAAVDVNKEEDLSVSEGGGSNGDTNKVGKTFIRGYWQKRD